MPPIFTLVVIGGAILAGLVFLLTRKKTVTKTYHPERHHYEDAH